MRKPSKKKERERKRKKKTRRKEKKKKSKRQQHARKEWNLIRSSCSLVFPGSHEETRQNCEREKREIES